MGEQWSAWDPMENARLDVVCIHGMALGPGDRVRLCPRPGADAFDLMLAGRIATIESIEQDYEDRVHIAVTVDEDPGKDFGLARKPGHRFFFSPLEIEPLIEEGLAPPPGSKRAARSSSAQWAEEEAALGSGPP